MLRTGRALVIATALAVPLVVAPFTASNTEVAKLTVVWVLGLVSLACWLLWWATRADRPPLPRIAVPAGALVAVLVLATLWSQEPGLSLRGTYSRNFGLLPLCIYVVWMLLTVAWFRSEPVRLDRVLGALGVAATVSSAMAILQYFGHDWLDWGLTRAATVTAHQDHRHNPTGTMGYHNFAGGLVGIALPALAYLFVRARGYRGRVLVAIAIAVNLGALWATHNRGGMLAGVVGLLAFGAASGLPIARAARVGGVLAIAGIVLAGAFVAWKRDAISWQPSFRKSVAPAADTQLLAPGSFIARTFAWQAAIRIVAHDPVLGTGPGTYYANFPPNRPRQSGAYDGLSLFDDPHQIFMSYAAGAGVLGLGTFLLVIATAIRRALRRVNALDRRSRLVLAGVLGCACGYLGQGLVSIDQPALAFLGWLTLGATAAFGEPPDAAEPRAPLSPLARGVLTKIGVLALVPLLVIGVRPLLADRMIKRGYRLSMAFATERAGDEVLASAIELDPGEPVYRMMAGDSAERRAVAADPDDAARLFRAATRRYAQALRQRPNNVIYLVTAARAYGEWARTDASRYDEANALWARAAGRDPHDYQVHSLWAQLLTQQADATSDAAPRRAAVRELRKAVALRGDHADMWVALAEGYAALGDAEHARRSARRALRIAPGDSRATSLLASIEPTAKP